MKVKIFSLPLVLLCAFSVAIAQEAQPGTPTAPSTPTAQPAAVDTESSSKPAELVPPPAKTEGTVTSIHDGSPLQAIPGMLHGGPIYLGSVSMTGMYESDTSDGAPKLTRGVGILSTYIFFTKELGRKENQLNLQYAPQLAIADGHFSKDLGGHEAQFDTSFQLTSRLRMSLHDGFHFAGLETQALQSGLLSDFQSGMNRQTDPLQHAGTYWVDEAQMGFSYDMTARTRFEISPDFSIVRSSSAAAQQGMRYGVEFRVDHEMSPRTNIGVVYSSQFSTYESALADALYQRFGLSFGHTFGRGWFVSGDIAAGASSSQHRQRWTPEPSLSITKAFRRSGFSMVFARTNAFYGLRNGYTNQADGTYRISLGRRYEVTFGGGSYRQSGTGVRNNSEYGRGALAVNLSRSLNWSANYMYRTQEGDTLFLQNGRRNVFSTTLAWSPGRRPTE